ncbi:type II secretion system F family protein [Caulobacter sp. S45]|uniref:type II secretion system F family protein n=1 Tax=Caulobacter sp. S45 TaxID=1641861 RepID=UPI001575579C|nr:type II secretion system F family protein [Caulobacter sp. S45]
MLVLLALLLAGASVGGVVFAFGWTNGFNGKVLKRAQSFATTSKVERSRRNTQDQQVNRRKKILTDLKAIDRQQRKKSLSLESRMQQAGLMANVRGFWISSAVIAGVMLVLGFIVSRNFLEALGLAFAAGLGLPRWVLGFLAKRRIKKFTSAFPDATDVIVRGIKSGLPVHDCLKVISTEAPKPLNEEFRMLVENLGMGMSMDQGLDKMFTRMPTNEVRFFAIVLGIQQKTGGNLAEALNNLSVVLRSRKMMAEKIKAMSGEAVASAGIIGVLPPAIMMLVQVTTPRYMDPMYQDSRGHIMLMIGAFWMGLGIFVMRKMINFKF